MHSRPSETVSVTTAVAYDGVHQRRTRLQSNQQDLPFPEVMESHTLVDVLNCGRTSENEAHEDKDVTTR